MSTHDVVGILIGLGTVIFVLVSAVVGAYNVHEQQHLVLRRRRDCLFCKRVWRE